MEAIWGLLGPEFLPNMRRTRTLELGASVRSFNDLAVPGMGGVWYGKQLLLATLGVAVAEQARNQGAKVQNIDVTNAIEALACLMAFNSNKWNRDARLHGRTKLQGKEDLSFQRVRQRNFYVIQPMRMRTVQTLPALGLVEAAGVRFNAFRCSEAGWNFIEQATKDYSPRKRTVVDHLALWVQGSGSDVITGTLQNALSPLEPLPNHSIPLLHEIITRKSERRRNALAWVSSLRTGKTTESDWNKPSVISEEHWFDLHAGALFFDVREAAIAALDAVEEHIGEQSGKQSLLLSAPFPDVFGNKLEKLKSAAKKYLEIEHVDPDAKAFCKECTVDEPGIFRALVKRDDYVLRLDGDEVKPGPAFRGTPIRSAPGEDEGTDTTPRGKIPMPGNISPRARNLYLLNLDMRSELSSWLNSESGANGGDA